MNVVRATVLPAVLSLGGMLGCGTSSPPIEKCPHGAAPYWRHIQAPDTSWQSPDDSLLDNYVFWNEGELWIWGKTAAGIWSIGTNRWREIPDHEGARAQGSPFVRMAAHQLIVFGGFERDVVEDVVRQVMRGWRFSEAEGWRAMSAPPDNLVPPEGALTSAPWCCHLARFREGAAVHGRRHLVAG
jgi:hypothetical protein